VQFAAELTQMLVRVDHQDWDARYLKAASLRARGYQEINTIARAWYLNGANELEGKVDPGKLIQLGMNVMSGSLSGGRLLQNWRYQVDAEKAGDTRLALGFAFTDSGDSYNVVLRNSILEITPGPIATGAPQVSLTAAQLRQAMKGEPLPDAAGEVKTLQKLVSYLDLAQPGFYMHVR
jgi:alkyl sulfatase BDS1-like metallo-beta-lactamase superfamily hydrolase